MEVLSVVGTVMSVVGAISQANSQSNAASYNAKVAAQNAEIARQQGEAAAQAQDRAARQRLGQMTAAYGASGVDMGSGSPLDVLQDSARTAALDNLTTRYNYNLRATGYSNQSTLLENQASNYKTSGILNGIGAGVKGATAYVGAGYPIPGMGSSGGDSYENSFDDGSMAKVFS